MNNRAYSRKMKRPEKLKKKLLLCDDWVDQCYYPLGQQVWTLQQILDIEDGPFFSGQMGRRPTSFRPKHTTTVCPHRFLPNRPSTKRSNPAPVAKSATEHWNRRSGRSELGTGAAITCGLARLDDSWAALENMSKKNCQRRGADPTAAARCHGCEYLTAALAISLITCVAGALIYLRAKLTPPITSIVPPVRSRIRCRSIVRFCRSAQEHQCSFPFCEP